VPNGTIVLPVPKKFIQQFGTGDRAAFYGFSVRDFLLFSLIFLLLPHLFSLYEG